MVVRLVLRWTAGCLLLGTSWSFVLSRPPEARTTSLRSTFDDDHSPQRKQERILEELSLQGADKIRDLSIPERAKRAMLAEAIEDRIFELTERLEELFDEETNQLPVRNRNRAVELAQTTKTLQTQYNELVSGDPSSVLNALESVMGTTPDDVE